MTSGELLTTCAGSGATLVAIIGGFLLTRYMAVEGEIRGANKAIQQVTLRLEVADDRVEIAARELTDYDIDDVLDAPNLLTALVVAFDNDVEMTAQSVRVLVAAEPFTDEELERRLVLWRLEVAKARTSSVWDRVRPQVRYDSLRAFMQSAKIAMEFESVWARLYEVEKDRKRLDPSGVIAPMDDYDLADPDAPRRSSYEQRLHEAEVARESTRAELRVAQTNRSSIAEPAGLRWEVLILLLVASLTILPSLLLLGPSPAHLSRPESACVIISFLAGLGLLIGYLLTWAERARAAWRESP